MPVFPPQPHRVATVAARLCHRAHDCLLHGLQVQDDSRGSNSLWLSQQYISSRSSRTKFPAASQSQSHGPTTTSSTSLQYGFETHLQIIGRSIEEETLERNLAGGLGRGLNAEILKRQDPIGGSYFATASSDGFSVSKVACLPREAQQYWNFCPMHCDEYGLRAPWRGCQSCSQNNIAEWCYKQRKYER